MNVIDCYSETSDIGPDIATIEEDGVLFTLVLFRGELNGEFGTVYFDDMEVMTGGKASEMLQKLSSARMEMNAEGCLVFNRILLALQNVV